MCHDTVMQMFFEFISPDFLILVFSLWVFLSLLSLFLSFSLSFRHFQTKAYFKIFRKRYIALFLSLSFRLVLLPDSVFFFSFPYRSCLGFPLSLYFVCIANMICAWQECTELLFEFRGYFFKKNWTALSVTAASDEDFFHRVNLFFPPKQAVLPPGQVKCSDTFKRGFLGSMTQYNFPVWGVQIVHCLKSTLYLQQLCY